MRGERPLGGGMARKGTAAALQGNEWRGRGEGATG